MESSLSATSRKSYDLPKPETGLAEWTNKIKALQKEVDADEEAEQKRLEDEIAAARQARLRRSRGNSASSRVNSSDIPTDKEQLNFPSNVNDTSANDNPRSAAERVNNQETALHKLMGRNDVYNPDKLPASARGTTGKPEAVSLATFIGGTATGPKLNRHASQQDAHDPTQFIQPDLSTPHPIFGRGGIAMPGMGSKGTKISASDVGSESSERYRPSTLTSTKSMSSLTGSHSDKIESGTKKDSADLPQRSFTSGPKPVASLSAQKQIEKDEPSQGKPNEIPRNQYTFSASPRPLSSAKSSSYLTKNEGPIAQDTSLKPGKPADTFRSSQNSFTSTLKPASSVVSTPARTWSASPTKSTDSWSAQNNLHPGSKMSTPSSLTSFSSKKEDPILRGTSPLPTKSVPTDNIRWNQNAFSSNPKSISSSSNSSSYLPKKEDTPVRSVSPTKSVNTLRTNSSTASKPLPSYLGTNASKTKPIVVGKATSSSLDTPLRRLMETNKVYNPDKMAAVDTPRKSVAERAQGVSLAAFMGGNGAGIRLNKHAPQQDAHDPTQFVQYNTSAPHPIFGRGGIAMPGMTARNVTKSSDAPGSESSERYRPSVMTRPTWPPVSSSGADKAEERPISPQKTGNRERTTSAPNSQVSNTFPSSSEWSSSNKVAGRQSPTKEIRVSTPARDRTISGPSYINNRNTFISPSPYPSSASASSLSRSIEPIPKSSSLSPHISGTINASSAFQKPPVAKDLTPSISRLQGRGFVQNMVKASSQFEASPSPSASGEKVRPLSAGGRKGSVLDRWQPNVQSNSPTKPSFPLYPSATRKSTTYESNENVQDKPQATKSSMPHTIKSVASLPSLRKANTTTSLPSTQEPAEATELYPRSRTPGLGSATTMVLIKPTKSSSDLTQLPHVDELGVKRNSWRSTLPDSDQNNASAEPLPSSKKPLIHPTKGRARKPRKHAESHIVPTDEPFAIASILETKSSEDRDITQPPAQTRSYNDSDLLQDQWDRSSLSNKGDNLHHEQPRHKELFSSIPILDPDQIQPADNTPISLLPSGGKRESVSVLEPASPKVIESTTPSKAFVPSPPSSPVKHTRIPSTGNRATVMEVAQALLDHPTPDPISKDVDIDSNHSKPILNREPLVTEVVAKPRPSSQIQTEKRKSSYEKYSAIILPSLKEEATPAPSPAGTLTRAEVKIDREELKYVTEPNLNSLNIQSTFQEPKTFTSPEYDEIPFPRIDFSKFIKPTTRTSTATPDELTVSLEILTLTGTTATSLTRSLDIFYETEILVIIHRTKSKLSGLASTSVWCWLGRKSILGDREERKLQELAKRYGTTAKIIHQLAEPPEFVEILGGRLATRQGTRTHWTSENTTMHLVRSLYENIMIDEHDLNVHNLCSAFSYCFTLLGSVYIWHGRGSTQQERDAALKYVETFSKDLVLPIVLLEGEDDNDEMFWMILGDNDFAKADYWQWRNASPIIDPSLWRIDTGGKTCPLVAVPFISMEQELQKSIYIVNCIWEFYLVVGKEARSDRRSIKFALDLVIKLSMEASSSRPYVPTVHVLILPSQIPLDLRLGIRDLDEAWMNDGEIPDHMNVIHSSEAVNHLSTHSWEQAALKDQSMLPLGVNVSIS